MIEETAKTKNLKSSNPTIKIASDKDIQKISKKNYCKKQGFIYCSC